MKLALKSIAIILLSVLMILNNSVVFQADEEQKTREGFVIGSDIRVRTGPSTSYAQLKINGELRYYNDGELVKIIGEDKDSDGDIWYNVKFYRGETEYEGWVCELWCQEIVTRERDPEFEAYMERQGFPKSYRSFIRKLHTLHPNWTFEAYQTGLDWQTAVNMESRLGYSLIDGSNTAYRSKAPGAYDSSTGKYIPFDGNNWYCANSQVVAYYMDPRNFINQINIFMFLNLGYKESETTEVIQKTLNGTFMSGKAPSSEKNYAQIFQEAGKNNKVSGLYLAVLARLEQGTNGSAATTGGTFSYNGKTYSNLYNYFNIGAVSSADNWKLGLVYANGGADGANTSYGRPWNTPERAINGGAEWISEGYICDGQDTMYLMKFNVSPIGTYGHQYMTNIRGAFIKSESMYLTYHDTGNITQDLTFSIPVYENMPEYTILPGMSIPVLENDDEVIDTPDPVDPTPVDPNPDDPNPEDPTPVDPEPQDPTPADPEPENPNPGEPELDDPSLGKDPEPYVPQYTGDFIVDLGIKNNNGLLSGFKVGITPDQIREVLSLSDDNAQLIIRTNEGLLPAEASIGTGNKIEVTDANGTNTYTIVIRGDVNGDGKINVKDLLLVKKDILDIEKLGGEYLVAGLAEGEEKVNLKSYKMIKKDILGMESVPQ